MLEWKSDITGLMPLVQALLSGFIAAWIFHGLTAHPKETQFERSVHALIFTALVQIPVIAVQRACMTFGWLAAGDWSKETDFLASMVSAVVVGLFVSVCANNDIPHRLLRKCGITKRTSFPSVWYNFFNGDWPQWAVLHLKGKKSEDIPPRRLYGWIFEWPDHPDSGHFVVMRAEWLGENNESTPITGVDRILVAVTEVELVEFVSLVSETAESVVDSKGVKNGQGQEFRRIESRETDSHATHAPDGARVGTKSATNEPGETVTATATTTDTAKVVSGEPDEQEANAIDGIGQRSATDR
jgi:hypothetical protein